MIGVLVMVASLLVVLAVITYSVEDDYLIEGVSPLDVFDPGVGRASNALGLIGAYLAHLLVPELLGFPSAGLGLLLFGWGYVIFRHRPAGPMAWVTVLALGGLLVLSAMVGWAALFFESDLGLWSGKVGIGLSVGLSQAFGTTGSIILLVSLAVILGLLAIDRDVQRTADRLERAASSLRSWFAERREERKIARAEARRLRAAERDEEEEETIPASATTRSENGSTSPQSSSTSRPTPASPARDSRGGAKTINDLFAGPAPRGPEAPSPDPPKRPVQTEAVASDVPTKPVEKPEPPAEGGGEVAFRILTPTEERRANPDERLVPVSASSLPYAFPSVELLESEDETARRVDFDELEEKKRMLLDKLEMHNIQLSNIEAIVGPTVTLFELRPAPGIKISQIKSLENDLAMALAARGIRMIAPIPGKSAVGLEIPNRHRELVRLRSVLSTERFRDSKMELPVILGKTIQNEVFITDLTKMPHLLIAGATGSGKSVGLNCLIVTLLYACHPADLKFVMIDPKKIELQQYAYVQDHFIAMPEDAEEPITTDFAHALGVLKSCIKEMEHRYDLLSDAGVRSIKEYNQRVKEGRIGASGDHRHLPHLVIIIDELADLMMTAGKEIEAPIARLAQMARAVGLHLVVATQRPSVNVITGLIKANFPSRVAYQVASGVDSRTIIDQYGAEQLVGNGDHLFMSGSRMMRLQSPYISLEEVEAVTRFIGDQEGAGPYILPAVEESISGPSPIDMDDGEQDDLFEEAARIIVRSQQGSVSLLQRKLSVGYTRAARIVDQLEDAGIVGPFEGSKARQVLIPDEFELDAFLKARKQEP